MRQVDPTHVPLHRRLIVRGYRIEHELAAFKHLLQFPDTPDDAAPHGWWEKSHWKLPFSPTFWLLVVLRHKGIETSVGLGDKPSLLSLREKIDNARELAPLRDVATGEIDWAEYVNTKGVHDNKIRALLEDIVAEADGLFTVPAAVGQEDQPYLRWHRETAQGIAINEAGSMGRPDAYAVWGNTLLPILQAGDETQLQPVVMALLDMDEHNNSLNRNGLDAKKSVLWFLKASGFPVYRLRTQLPVLCCS